ncbi:TetR/AcrR family transcriptional regulator [Phenylobacterium montanum]|uniref:TetR family transcriptional regulator n=1 Tax=Phenylobacterium montanum TaxID=2823693 RepID=A0A975FYC2_9CAUL|nr:TetR/AcrR family transcriptional regulator [Caulobacter sp. S6]QUD87426.1 TetR family transcriptional regulator [Caulobacter sp. S6]
MTAQAILTPRKTPAQGRSRAMVETIVEAAARVLEEAGAAGFNTNAVAARAGVSVGSLYQYFPGKQALVAELSRRGAETLLADLAAAVEAAEAAPEGSLREDVRRLAQAAIAWQCRRPALERALDQMEAGLDLPTDARGTASQIQALIVRLIGRRLPGLAPDALSVAAADSLALARALIDQAVARGDAHEPAFEARLTGALCGYLSVVAAV